MTTQPSGNLLKGEMRQRTACAGKMIEGQATTGAAEGNKTRKGRRDCWRGVGSRFPEAAVGGDI